MLSLLSVIVILCPHRCAACSMTDVTRGRSRTKRFVSTWVIAAPLSPEDQCNPFDLPVADIQRAKHVHRTKQRQGSAMRRAILACAICALLSACGSKGTAFAHDNDGGTTVTMGDTGNGPAMVAKVAAVSQTVAPSDLPVWAPVYPGATVSQVVDIAFHRGEGMPGGPHRQVVFMTSDPLAKVSAFYEQKIAATGVKPMMTSNQPDAAIWAMPAPGGQPDTISVGKSDGQTAIALTYEVKR